MGPGYEASLIHSCGILCLERMLAVKTLDLAILYVLQCLGYEAMTPKPNQRVFVQCMYEGKDAFIHFRKMLPKHL